MKTAEFLEVQENARKREAARLRAEQEARDRAEHERLARRGLEGDRADLVRQLRDLRAERESILPPLVAEETRTAADARKAEQSHAEARIRRETEEARVESRERRLMGRLCVTAPNQAKKLLEGLYDLNRAIIRQSGGDLRDQVQAADRAALVLEAARRLEDLTRTAACNPQEIDEIRKMVPFAQQYVNLNS